MQRFREIHKGKRVWLLGCGTSLLEIDFEIIPKEDIIIACNNSVLRAPRFEYACFTDGVIPYFKYYDNLSTHPCDVISFNKEEIRAVKKNTFFIEKNRDKSNLKFTLEDKQVCFGIDIVHCALHFAFMLGAKEIILCGVDYYIDNGNYHWNNKLGFDPELNGTQPVHLNPNNNDNSYHFGEEINEWKRIIKANPDLPIINSSLKSKVPFYPKKSFKEIINVVS